MNRLSALFFSFLFSSGAGFQIHTSATSCRIGSIPSVTQLAAVQTNPYAQRDYNGFVNWASYYGANPENFQITEQAGEWGVVATQGGQAGQRALYVPAMLRLASQRIRDEEFPQLQQAIAQFLDATNSNGNINLACQFYLFLKVLQEYDQGEQSPYYSWLDALPRKFNTALTFDEFEIECLPPFVKYLSQLDRHNYGLFVETLQQLPTPTIADATKYNAEVTKWAFNVVFTRARAAFGEAEIIPMADMLNHKSDPNVRVDYDAEGNVHVVFLKDVQPGEPLFKCYGQHTNPSRFLATYGFFDTSPPATYCKLMAGKTLTPELVNLGFVHEKMVFWVENGAVAEEVWDVMLYTVLGSIDPATQRKFYDAHIRGDYQTKENLRQMYRLETTTALLQHVDQMLGELSACAVRMDNAGNSLHEHIPMIRQHNEFVRETFLKVRFGLGQIRSSVPTSNAAMAY